MIRIPNPTKKERVRYGQCARCGDFGRLNKSVWNDPYTDTDGIGYLCDDCFEKTQPLRSKYGIDVVERNVADLSNSFNPVPKPIFKKKKKKGGEE